MSIKKELDKLLAKLKELWEKFKKSQEKQKDKQDEKQEEHGDQSSFSPIPLPNPSLASCWEGKSAATRHMNELSFHFTDEQIESRLDWAKSRGCNTVHWFVCNQADGEGAGYNIYSGEPTIGKYDKWTIQRMANRIKMANKKGFAVVLWLMADDSSRWNSALLKDVNGYAKDLKDSGLLDMASSVVLGLEMDEYIKDKSKVKEFAEAIRSRYSGKIGVHHTSGKGTYAEYGDILYWQTATGLDEAAIKRSVKSAAAYGKPVNAFELERNPQRGLAQAALDAGAIGVGNW